MTWAGVVLVGPAACTVRKRGQTCVRVKQKRLTVLGLMPDELVLYLLTADCNPTKEKTSEALTTVGCLHRMDPEGWAG